MDFENQQGTALENVDMTGSRFTRVDFTGSTFRAVALHGAVMRDVEVSNTSIDGEIESLVVNGVDVAPLVEAELDRRHPERPLFRATTADEFREAWDVNERLWAETVARARRLPGSSCTSRSGTSGPSSRRSAISRSCRRRGCVGACSAIRAPGTRCRCRGTRWNPGTACRTTATPAPRWTTPSGCAWRRWRGCAAWSTA